MATQFVPRVVGPIAVPGAHDVIQVYCSECSVVLIERLDPHEYIVRPAEDATTQFELCCTVPALCPSYDVASPMLPNTPISQHPTQFLCRNRCCARDDVVVHLRSIYARANPGTRAADIATLQFYLFDNSAGSCVISCGPCFAAIRILETRPEPPIRLPTPAVQSTPLPESQNTRMGSVVPPRRGRVAIQHNPQASRKLMGKPCAPNSHSQVTIQNSKSTMAETVSGNNEIYGNDQLVPDNINIIHGFGSSEVPSDFIFARPCPKPFMGHFEASKADGFYDVGVKDVLFCEYCTANVYNVRNRTELEFQQQRGACVCIAEMVW